MNASVLNRSHQDYPNSPVLVSLTACMQNNYQLHSNKVITKLTAFGTLSISSSMAWNSFRTVCPCMEMLSMVALDGWKVGEGRGGEGGKGRGR